MKCHRGHDKRPRYSRYRAVFGSTITELAAQSGCSPALIHVWLSALIPQELKKLDPRLLCCFGNIVQRCEDPRDKKYSYYGGKGVRNFLTIFDLVKLWHRDRAAHMRHPSIDRLDSNGDYTIQNSRFIEMETNRLRRFTKVLDSTGKNP